MNIIDIFYNYIVKEATTGRVNCYMYYNLLFDTYLVEENRKVTEDIKYEGALTPTLIIKNKTLFNELLEKYVSLSLEFYDDSNFLEEVINKEEFKEYGISKEKTIMTLLWSNATYDDFADPILFLRKRIAFLESNIGEISHEFEFSPMLDGRISLAIEKDRIYNETPYKIVIKVTNDAGETYEFPEIKFGIFDNRVYFYAIQSNNTRKDGYAKRVNRVLFKIGEGFNAKEDNYEIYGDGNLKDVSASFLVALNMAISYLHNIGFEKMCASSILISRWNAKKIALHNQFTAGKITQEEKEILLEQQELLQRNLTEKFLRTFLRLMHHYNNMNLESIPFQVDSNLHLEVSGEVISNNTLLNETAECVKSTTKNKNI